MHLVKKWLLLFTLLTSKAISQNVNTYDLKGKIFIGSHLEYLEFINDSTLYSSINPYNDTAKFSLANDTLRIIQHYFYTDKNGSGHTVELHEYKIGYSNDSLFIQKILWPNKKIELNKKWVTFINLVKLKEPVTDFKYLEVICSSVWTGEKTISINSNGKVTVL